jgi:hypothetical protein
MRTNMSSSDFFAQLVDGRRILNAEGTLVPAPPGAEHPGNHLFVNCLYTPDITQQKCESILACAQADTILILQHLIINNLLTDVTSVCITFIVNLRPAGSRYRLYRYSILTSLIAKDLNAINKACFVSPDCIQSSEDEEIAALLAKND